MKKLSNPKDLLVAQLSEILWVERRLAFDVLPKLVASISDTELKTLVAEHLEETKQHVERVEGAFRGLGMEPSSALSPGASALFDHHDEVAGKIVEATLADRWHASAAIATEHLELALYAGAAIDSLKPNVEDEANALDQLERWLGR